MDGLGWEEKIRDLSSFILRHNYHMVIFLETRTRYADRLFEGLVPNYMVVQYDTCSTSKGNGVAVLLRQEIQHLVQLEHSSENLQLLWLRCAGSLFNVNGFVLMGAVYINPETLGRRKEAIESCFEDLQDETFSALSQTEHVVLVGDFNAHIGSQSEFIEEHFDLQDEFPCLQTDRQNISSCQQVNHAGRLLLELACECPLILTTGRGRGDAGQASYVGYGKNCSTRPDHVLVTRGLFRNLHHCSVQAPENCISDHCAVDTTFLSKHDIAGSNQERQGCQRNCRHKVFRWRPENSAGYVHALQSNLAAHQQFEILVSEKKALQAYDTLCGMIHTAADTAGMGRVAVCHVCRQRREGLAGVPKAPWFDASCDLIKRSYMTAFRERRATREMKQVCRRVLSTAKRVFYKKQGEIFLDKLEKRDPSIYEMLQRKPAVNTTTPISDETWTTYLRNHFASRNDDECTGKARGRGLGREGAVPLGRGRMAQTQGTRDSSTFSLPGFQQYYPVVLKYINKMNDSSSPGFQTFSAAFLKRAVVQDGEDKVNILAPFVAKLMHLILVTRQMPADWKTAKMTPIYKKGPKIEAGNYRMIAVSGTLYRLFANTLKELLMDWCNGSRAIPDTQYGFYPGRSTLQPMFILRHLVHAAQRIKPYRHPYMHTAFVDFSQAYDTVPRPKLWEHLQKIGVPRYLTNILREIYRGDEYILIDGDKRASTQGVSLRGVKQGCPLSPLLFTLYISDVDDAFQECTGAITGTETLRVTHLLFADDLALTANHTGHLQQMLHRLQRYVACKGLVVNTDKTQVVNFNAYNTSTVEDVFYDGKRLEKQDFFKYLGMLFDRRLNLTNSLNYAAKPFQASICRIKELAADKGFADRPHAMLWVFKACAISAGMYASQLWSTPFLRSDKVFENKLQVKHLGFLKRVLKVKNSAVSWAVLRECAQEPLQFYWFRAVGRFWNSMVRCNSITLRAVLKADVALGNSGCVRCWSRQFKDAMSDLRSANELRDCLWSFKEMNLSRLAADVRFRHHTVWREAEGQDPRSYRKKSAVYHNWFGLPLREYSESKPSARVPSYLTVNLNRKVMRDVSRFRLRAHGLKCETGLYDRDTHICDVCDIGEVQDEIHVVFRCTCPFLVELRQAYGHLFRGLHRCDLKAFTNQNSVDVYKFLSALIRFFD